MVLLIGCTVAARTPRSPTKSPASFLHQKQRSSNWATAILCYPRANFFGGEQRRPATSANGESYCRKGSGSLTIAVAHGDCSSEPRPFDSAADTPTPASIGADRFGFFRHLVLFPFRPCLSDRLLSVPERLPIRRHIPPHSPWPNEHEPQAPRSEPDRYFIYCAFFLISFNCNCDAILLNLSI